MKYKSLIYVGAMTVAIGAIQASGEQVLADQILADPTHTKAKTDDNVSGELAVELERDKAKITLSDLTVTANQVKATLWTNSIQSKTQEINFVKDEEGHYQAFVTGEGLVMAGETETIFLQVEVLTEDGKQFLFQDYQFIWKDEVDKALETDTKSESEVVTPSKQEPASTSPSTSASAAKPAPSSTAEQAEKAQTTVTTAAPATKIVLGPGYGAAGPKVTGTINIKNVNTVAGTFDIVISNIVGATTIQTVQVPVWTDTNGQDDIKWYTAVKQADGSYKVTVRKKDHKNEIGLYHAHLYYQYTNGKHQGIANTSFTLPAPNGYSGTLSIQNMNDRLGTFDVIVSNIVGSNIQAVQVPVWTDEFDQDDLKWYTAMRQADGTYKVTINKKDHKNGLGKYHAHLYYKLTDGSKKGIASTTTTLQNKPQGKLSITNVNEKQGSFDIVISDIVSPKAISSIQVPVWTDANNQDDLKWYTAIKQANGTYKVTVNKKDHKNEIGLYHVHLYYNFVDKTKNGIASTTTHLNLPVGGKLSVANLNEKTGTFDLIVSEVYGRSTIQAVRIPVWTEVNNQDDLKWYTATRQGNGTYKVTINKKDHKNEIGLYHAHLYYKYNDGSLQGIATTKIDLPAAKPSATVSIKNNNSANGTFDVVVTNAWVPGHLSTVQVPVWSEVNGQDDIKWYTAIKQGDGSFKATVSASDHKYDTGIYHAHVYLQQSDGKRFGVANTKVNVAIKSTAPTAIAAIINVDNSYGTFDVVVKNIFAPAGIDKVEIPVWTDANGQNDIVWYPAERRTDGTYRITVRLVNHKYEQGLVNAHVYITSQGKRYGVAKTATTVNYIKKAGKSFIDVSSHNGALSTDDYRKLMQQGVSGVVVKLTEGTSYRNPYAAGQIKNAQAVGLKVSVYHYSHFTDAKSAREEAQYFVQAAKELGLSRETVMVNDIEEAKSRNNVNTNMEIWESEMKRLGYSNLVHYAGASWLDRNEVNVTGPITTAKFGMSNFWVAHYPYYKGMSADQAREMSLYAGAAAWQFTSVASLLNGRSYFDLNIDYSGRFTN
ncbi:GBS Bsp-like repeat-containing protein [Streptococcus gallolyticus]|nr:GBS Bsp-like repeat-containing protein [Streptococcus gallolyticus]MBY5041676.1 GBS Bsp-like repeat-containing protein [Streptococcus gallolyticus]